MAVAGGGVLSFEVYLDRSQAAAIDHALVHFSPSLRVKLRKELREGLQEARDWMIVNKLTGGPRSYETTATRLSRRTGELIRSVKTAVVVSEDMAEGQLFIDPSSPAAVYAPTHEYGAHIVPRVAQYLTVPLLPAALRGKSAKDIPGLFLVRSRKGNLLLAVREPGVTGITPLYVLREYVDIPARPYLEPTAERFFPRILARMEKAVELTAQEG